MIPYRSPVVRLGRLVITPAATAAVPAEEVAVAVRRHLGGDWGELDAEDRQANDAALRGGGRLLSEYRTAAGTPYWVVTEADRSVTTILLPDDY